MNDLKIFPWERDEKPYFSNDKADYYLDKDSTSYAKKKMEDAVVKKDIVVWLVKFKDNSFTRLAIDNGTQEVLHEDRGIEDMGAWLDFYILSLQK